MLLTGISSGGVAVLGGLSQEKTANPGDVYENTIHLKNDSETSCEVRIYQTDYAFLANGETSYDDPGTSPRSNADWLSISPRWVSVPGMSAVSVHYRVQVPDDADLQGTYWSVVMVEPTETMTQVVSDESGNRHVGIQTLVRYGVQIVTNIGDTGARDVLFRDTRLVKRDGQNLLEIDLENTGETWLLPLFSLELYDEKGTNSYHFDGQQQRVFPGCSVRHRIDLTGIPNGKYRALAIVDNRDEYVFGAQYDIWIE
jgi:hypothetical protein